MLVGPALESATPSAFQPLSALPLLTAESLEMCISLLPPFCLPSLFSCYSYFHSFTVFSTVFIYADPFTVNECALPTVDSLSHASLLPYFLRSLTCTYCSFPFYVLSAAVTPFVGLATVANVSLQRSALFTRSFNSGTAYQ